MGDAQDLLAYAQAFNNQRKRGMRKELRERIGDALRVAKREMDELDCLESDDLFVVFKPSGTLGRDDFKDLRPLLRQSLVAGCAALETYVADKAMEYVGAALNAEKAPARLRDVPLSIGRWLDIEARYERKGWGIRYVVDEQLREVSGPAPDQIGAVLEVIGVRSWAKDVDKVRKVPSGTTEEELDRIADRCKKIAHAGDRTGQGRAKIERDDVARDLRILEDVAKAIEQVLSKHTP